MIMSVARANADEAAHANVLGAWSDLVVDERPTGLLDCYLVTTDADLQVIAIWDTIEVHDRAVDEVGSHPGYAVFEAAGLDCTHSLHKILGSIRQ